MTAHTAGVRVGAMVRRPIAVNPLLRIAGGVALVTLSLRIPVAAGVTVGTLAALALLPWWWSSLAAFRGARLLALGGAVAVATGCWLTWYASTDRDWNLTLLISSTALTVGLVAGVGIVLWCRQLMSDSWVAVLFAIGIAVNLVLLPQGPLFASNPWKFGFLTPVVIVGLVVAATSRRRWVHIVVVISLIAAAAANDARSSSAILALALILTVLQLRGRRAGRSWTTLRFVLSAAAAAVVVFNVGQTLILDGYLGDAARERTVEQIDTSGSLLLGGRPEIAATLALMLHRPIGYGAGIIPNLSDITVAKTGMAQIGYQPNNGYVENYMFGGRFELHSMVGDLWVGSGWAGVAFALILTAVTVRALSGRIARAEASPLSCYLAVSLFWNLLFSPLYSSLPLTVLCVGLMLVARAPAVPPETERADGDAARPARTGAESRRFPVVQAS